MSRQRSAAPSTRETPARKLAVPYRRGPAGRPFGSRGSPAPGGAHHFGRVAVSAPSRSPIQAFSFKERAKKAAGAVGGAIKKKAGAYAAKKKRAFKAPFEAAENFKEGFSRDKLGSLRVGLGVLGISGGLKGADARELHREKWESYFQSLPEEERDAARERFRLKPKKGSAGEDAPASSFAGAGAGGAGERGGDGCHPGQVPGEGARPPRSSFDRSSSRNLQDEREPSAE